MTPTELLKKLEGLGTIEPKALRKIRIQIEDPERTVKVSAVLSYLVRKGQLTEDNARQLMRGETPAVKRRATDELMLGVIDEEPTAEAIETKKKPKRSNREPIAPPEPILLPDPMPADVGATAYDYGQEAYDEFGNNGEEKAKPTFGGKIDKRDQWNSRWPYIGFGVLGFLMIVGMFLYFAVFNMEPQAMFENARDHYDNASYQAAIQSFDEYIDCLLYTSDAADE